MNLLSRAGALVLSCAFAMNFCGCNPAVDSSDPKAVVIALFGAMERDDEAQLARVLDMASLMKAGGDDYALSGGTPRVFRDPRQIFADLTKDGETKRRWFAYQRTIGASELIDSTAFVTVLFQDKQSGQAYQTKFGLHKILGKWRIYSFKTVES